MLICFTLSMSQYLAWNGEGPGKGNLYAIVKNMGRRKIVTEKAKKILRQKKYYYEFQDGWIAKIDVHEVTAKEAVTIRRRSKGFCSYDWMVDSIIKHGKIINIPIVMNDYFNKIKKEINFPLGTILIVQSWSVLKDLKNFCGFFVMLTNVPSEREFFFGFPYGTSQKNIKAVADYLNENPSPVLGE